MRGGDLKQLGEDSIMAELAARIEAIKKANEPKIYEPEFIPFYLDVWKKHKLSEREVLLYGFIKFFTGKDKHGKSRDFYFSNEDLAGMLGWKNDLLVTRAINKLKEKGLIETSLKQKANGGQIRFIKMVE